ncbi:hypothetical protein CLF_113132, partial [Clonorchis sinensis]
LGNLAVSQPSCNLRVSWQLSILKGCCSCTIFSTKCPLSPLDSVTNDTSYYFQCVAIHPYFLEPSTNIYDYCTTFTRFTADGGDEIQRSEGKILEMMKDPSPIPMDGLISSGEFHSLHCECVQLLQEIHNQHYMVPNRATRSVGFPQVKNLTTFQMTYMELRRWLTRIRGLYQAKCNTSLCRSESCLHQLCIQFG